MSKSGGTGNKFEKRTPSNPTVASRMNKPTIGGGEQRIGGAVNVRKLGPGSEQVTNRAAFNQMMNSPITKKEKVQSAASTVKNKVTGVGSAIKNKVTGKK